MLYKTYVVKCMLLWRTLGEHAELYRWVTAIE
jgi:hypothetical protein